MVQVFVDMDGVLADFDTGYQVAFGTRPDNKINNVDWKAVREYRDFYKNLPPMPDLFELWSGVKALHPNPIILTGIPRSVAEAHDNKRAWVDRWLGEDVEMITCQSWRKSEYIRNPGDIIIDDWDKHRHLWEKRGGRWILHTSAKTSLEELKRMLEEDASNLDEVR